MPWRSPVLPGWGQCMELEEEHPRDPTPTRRNLKLRSFSGCQATEPVPKSGDVGTSRFCGGAALAVRGPCPVIAQCVSVGSVPRAETPWAVRSPQSSAIPAAGHPQHGRIFLLSLVSRDKRCLS